jgi:hypothetical protein
MTQHNVAFLTGHAYHGESAQAALLEEAERFVRMGRRNLVLLVDPSIVDRSAIPALARLVSRVAELGAELTCVALDERVIALIRTHHALDSMRVIQRVDQIKAVA